MTNEQFRDLPLTRAADTHVLDTLAKMKAGDRRYFEQALINEWVEIESINHQYMTMGDVLRVIRILKIK